MTAIDMLVVWQPSWYALFQRKGWQVFGIRWSDGREEYAMYSLN